MPHGLQLRTRSAASQLSWAPELRAALVEMTNRGDAASAGVGNDDTRDAVERAADVMGPMMTDSAALAAAL